MPILLEDPLSTVLDVRVSIPTAALISRLASLLQAESLDFSALPVLLNCIPETTPLVLKPYRSWCSECYAEDCGRSHGPYDRLLWSIEQVEACPIHEVKLSKHCPTCGATEMPVLMGYDISGFCPHCTNFLGFRSVPLNAANDDLSRYLIWTAKSFADLLDSPVSPWPGSENRFQEMIRNLSDFHFDGAYSRFATAISRNRSVVGTWLANNSKPGWRALCEISFSFHIPLRDLLSGCAEAVGVSVWRPLPLTIRQRYQKPKRTPRKRDTVSMLHFINEVADGKHPSVLSVRDLALRLDIDASDLRKRARQEVLAVSQILADRRRSIRTRMTASRDRDLTEAISTVGIELAQSNLPATRRRVESKLTSMGFRVSRVESKSVRLRVLEAKALATVHMSGNS
jgi:hypothetical protein